MANILDLDRVKQFLVSHGGKVRNHDIVTYFKGYLNDPENKNVNRETFKDCINKLASVKSENGEKMIILKKKYRPAVHAEINENVNPESNAIDEADGKSETASLSSYTSREGSTEVDKQNITGSDASSTVSTTPDRSRESSSGMQADISRESSVSMEEAGVQEVSPIVSVKDRALFLNQMQTQEEEEEPSPHQTRKKTRVEKTTSLHSEDDPALLNMTDPVERGWMVTSAKSDYQAMARTLLDYPYLASKKELTSGYTPLHWACKHGQPDVVKLLAGKYKAPVNSRSHGGYTPLHMAALHGHEDLIQLLVQTYYADVNVRDYSGKKPKHYLKISAQAHTQHHVRVDSRYLLQPARKPDASDDSDANGNVKSSSGKSQGISSLLIPLNNNIRASFRKSKTTSSTRSKSPPRSPNLFRRASEKTASSNKSSKKKVEKQRPVSEQSDMSGVQVDPEMVKKSFFI